MARTSYIRQIPASIEEAEAVQWPVPAEVFQLLDPPLVSTSPEKKVHRDCEIFKVSVTATTAGATPTLFRVMLNNAVDDTYDLLDGGGVLPILDVDDSEAGRYAEWWLNPRPLMRSGLARVYIVVSQIGTGVRGLIFEVCFI